MTQHVRIAQRSQSRPLRPCRGSAPASLLTTLLVAALACSPAATSAQEIAQSEPPVEDPNTVVGYVAAVDGDLLVLSNVPTVEPARVFQLGAGRMFIATGAEGEAVTGARRAPGAEGEVVAGAAGTGTEETRVIFRRSRAEPVTTEPKARSATGESEAEERVGQVAPPEGSEGNGAAGGSWIASSEDAAPLPTLDVPLELRELRLGAEVVGRDLLLPGLQVRVHLSGEGDDRVVDRVELMHPETSR